MKSATYPLKTLLEASGPIVALVADRIYFSRAQQERLLPDIIIRPVSVLPEAALSGHGPPWRSRMQVTIRSLDYTQAEAIGELVLAALNGFAGVVGDQQIHHCMVVLDTMSDDDTTNVMARILDFRVHHS